MTRKLEELLDLAPIERPDADDSEVDDLPVPYDIPDLETQSTIEKITSSLPAVTGLGETGDRELDDIASKAVSAYEDLMDLGMNVEAKYSTRVFEVAASMLRNALDAKNAKINNKLKMVELQLKHARLEHEQMSRGKKKTTDDDDVVAGSAVIVSDRNSLIEKLKNMKS